MSYGGRGGYNQRSEEEQVMGAMMIKLTMSINKQCFTECVNSFREEALTASEKTCIGQCAARQSGAFAAMNDISQQLSAKGGMF